MDVSNSFTKWSHAGKKRLGRVHRLPTREVTTAWLKTWKKNHGGLHLVLSSVVPACGKRITAVFGKSVLSIHGGMDLGVRVDYPRPHQIGADRLANSVAARALYGVPAVVIDFGTAVTFDIVNAKGAYCGGVIAPGLNAMTDYLHERTALLPRIELREPVHVIGKSTEEAMQIGAFTGYRGLVKGILDALKKKLAGQGKLRVVATGGHAEVVAAGLPGIRVVNPLLTLEGLRIIGVRHGY